jgi:hypothetical protein
MAKRFLTDLIASVSETHARSATVRYVETDHEEHIIISFKAEDIEIEEWFANQENQNALR